MQGLTGTPAELVVDERQVEAFAQATGDDNPLHVSADFARRTPYGRPIAHGALVALAAMATQGAGRLEVPDSLVVQFRRPVFPGRRYEVHPVVRKDRGGWSLTVTDAGVPALSVRAGRSPGAVTRPADTVPASDGGPSTWTQRYRLADAGGLRRLLSGFGDDLPERFLLPLSWASWFTGMVMPGRDALLSQIVASPLADAGADLDWQARLTRDDPRFGSVATSATWTAGGHSGVVHVEAFRRAASPSPARATTAALLAPSNALTGDVLVVGGSRGIGAALTAALASQGATVHVAYASSSAQVDALSEEFGADRVRPVPLDATDADSVGAAVAALAGGGVALDGIVLCAAPALQALPLHPDTADDALDHVDRALRMAWLPLTHALPLLQRGSGWVVVMSSAAVHHPPPHWAHYVAAKGALEGVACSLARDAGVAVLVARPPRVWTDLTNGPGADRDALSPDQVAVRVVRWVLEAPAPTATPAVLEADDFRSPRG